MIEGDSESLLGEDDAYRLGIVDIHRNGATRARAPETTVRRAPILQNKIGIQDIPITENVRRARSAIGEAVT